MNIVNKIESKQTTVLLIKYCNKHYTLDILYWISQKL